MNATLTVYLELAAKNFGERDDEPVALAKGHALTEFSLFTAV